MRLVFLAEVTALDPRTDELVTLRMCSRGQGHVRLPDYDHEFIPCIVAPPVQTRTFNENGIPGEIQIDYGSMTLAFHRDLRNTDWRRFDFDSYPAKLWWGEYDQPFSTFKPIPAGRVGSLALTSPVQGTLAILGPDAELKKSILSASYAGTGGAEGSEDLKGTLKPFRIGRNENIEAQLIDNVNLIYQYHGYGLTGDVEAVYENALTLGEPAFTASSYEQLAGYTATQLPPGTWAKAPAVGMFRLGAEPSGKITADVVGATEGGSAPRTIGAICSYVLRHHAGVPADKIDEVSAARMDRDFPHTWGNGIDAQTKSEDEDDNATVEFSVGEFVREACSHISGYLFADAQGIWRFGRNVSTKAPTTLRQRGTSNPIVIEGTIQMPATSTRVHRVRVGGRRCFAVHSDSEVSSALKDAVDAVAGTIGAVSDRADEAIENANVIRRTLPDLVLPILRKPIDDISALQLEYGSAQLKATSALHRDNRIAIEALGTRVDEDGSIIAEKILQLTSKVDDEIDGVKGRIEAGLLDTNRTIANTNFSLSESIRLQIANFGDDVNASFVEERRVRSEKDNALAEDIRLMGVKLVTDVEGERTTREGSMRDLNKLIVDVDGALGERLREMGVRITTEIGQERTDREAAIRDVQRTIVDATTGTVTAEQINELSAKIDRDVGAERTTREGVIRDVQRVQADDNGARAEETRNLKARLDNQNGTSIEQRFLTFANQIDGIGSQYVLKLQTEINGLRLIGGFGIANQNGYVDTAFTTDAFRIYTAQGAKQIFYADGNGVLLDRAMIGTLEGSSLRVTNASVENLTISGDKFEPSAVTSVGSFERDYYGWHVTDTSGFRFVGGEANPVGTSVRTGNSAAKIIITCTGIWERDGGDDDNLNITVQRYGGNSSALNYLSIKQDVQVFSGRRPFVFRWIDENVDPNTDYTYRFMQQSLRDGSPYYYNVTFDAIAHKK